MLKYFAGIILLIALVLIVPYALITSSAIYPEAVPPEMVPHVYGNSRQSLEAIDILAVYFVPANKKSAAIPHWRALLQSQIDGLEKFHRFQFWDRSHLAIRIYPVPVIGEHTSSAYDTDVTQHGNPAALETIVSELERRVLNPAGDQYMAELMPAEDSYPVLVVLYEGVGASGAEGAVLLSRFFLTGEEYAPFRTTFFTHEFYHALGAPDRYTVAMRTFSDGQSALTEILESKDIMGIVRAPIEHTYLDAETLRQFGL